MSENGMALNAGLARGNSTRQETVFARCASCEWYQSSIPASARTNQAARAKSQVVESEDGRLKIEDSPDVRRAASCVSSALPSSIWDLPASICALCPSISDLPSPIFDGARITSATSQRQMKSATRIVTPVGSCQADMAATPFPDAIQTRT